MSSMLLKSAMKLSKAERILLVEQIWDSIAEAPDGPALLGAQKRELARRLVRLRKTGPLGSSWTEVKKRLKNRT